MCASPYDCAYAAYGGLLPRVNQFHGRVGSILDPAAVIKVAADQKAEEPTPAEIPDNSGEITAIPLDSDLSADDAVDPDFSFTSDVEELFNTDQEFEPFGQEFAGPAYPNRHDELGLDAEQEPGRVIVIDAEPLVPTPANESEATDVEALNPSTLRLLNASGTELPISE